MVSKRSQMVVKGGLMIESYNDIKMNDTIEATIIWKKLKNKRLTRKKRIFSDFPGFNLSRRVPMASHFRTISRDGNQAWSQWDFTKESPWPRVFKAYYYGCSVLGDLSMAKVYSSIMSDLASDNQKARTGLEKATGTIKRRWVGIWNCTRFRILYCQRRVLEYGNKIDEMLHNLRRRLRERFGNFPWLKDKVFLETFLR